MLRSKWELSFSPASLIKAAEKQVKYHEERIKFWEKKQTAAVKDATRHGLIVTIEPVKIKNIYARGYSGYSGTSGYSVYGDQRASISVQKLTVNTKIQDKIQSTLNTCHSRIKRNLEHIIEYSNWIRF